jgi:anti-sigma B factor antagonist
MSLPSSFDVVVSHTEGRTVASVRGEIDIATAPVLRSALTEAAGGDHLGVGGVRLTVDFANVSFIDASGLGVLVGAARRARRDGSELVLRNPSPAMMRLLDITKLVDVFTIEWLRLVNV